jgi:hypothetical protein
MPSHEDDGSWAVTEFAGAELGDERRTQRLVNLATVLSKRPESSLPQACGNGAVLKAAYRFFDNDAIIPQEMLNSHVVSTILRIVSCPLVLAPQDTTSLDWTTHSATEGLGPLNDPDHHGLFAHTTLAVTPERVPLGLLAQQVWARDPDDVGKRQTRKHRPIEQKESHKWLLSLRAVIQAQKRCPDTQFVSIGDREADVFDLFLEDRPQGVDLLVRAAWNRKVAHPESYLWDRIAVQKVVKRLTVQIPRRGNQKARKARLALRFCPVRLCPPKHRAHELLPLVDVWAVHVAEQAPPDGIDPIEWLLLSTRPVLTVEDAVERVDWYSCRWGIELFHKVLKSGCRIEARQLESAQGLHRCLLLYSVIAWRILYAVMLSRNLPNLPCTALLEPEEWQALYCTIHQTPTVPVEPPTLRQAVRWIGRLGGFLGRKGDGEPGVTVLWRGFQSLTDLTTMYRILRLQTLTQKNVGKP